MSDKELDQLFQSRFDSFEAEPAASLWSSIESQLENKPGKRAGMPVFWMAAASVVVLLGAGLWLFRPEEKVYLKGETVLAKVRQQPVEEIPAENQEILTQPAEIQPARGKMEKPVRTKTVSAAAYLAAEDKREQEPAVPVVRENEVMFAKVQEPVTEKEPTTVMAAAATEEATHSRRGEVHQTVLAMLPPEETAGVEKPLQERRKIRSVGDIVNFVVAKVDQREDKLIEMAEDDEGTRISGINLGLFKIKSKKR